MTSRKQLTLAMGLVALLVVAFFAAVQLADGHFPKLKVCPKGERHYWCISEVRLSQEQRDRMQAELAKEALAKAARQPPASQSGMRDAGIADGPARHLSIDAFQ